MKTGLAAVTMICLLASSGCRKQDGGADPFRGTISISGAFALYPMAIKWAEEYKKIHPQVEIDISAGGAGKGMADVLSGLVDIGMVSREIQPAEAAKGAWWVPVAKDAVVAVVSAENPFSESLRRHGLKKEALQAVWLQDEPGNWEELTGGGAGAAKTNIHVYTRSDSCGAAETWALFFGKKQEDLHGIGVYGDPGLAEAVKKDRLGIGYNNINFAFDPDTLRPISGLVVLPLDLDSDGTVNSGEDFYGTRDSLVQAVSTGRYPSPPARDLYFVCKDRPQKELLRNFLSWVLLEGQKHVTASGYVSPAPEKVQNSLEKLRR